MKNKHLSQGAMPLSGSFSRSPSTSAVRRCAIHFAGIVLLIGLLPMIALAKPLSKQGLLTLQKANVSDSVIIENIKANGIDFDVTPGIIVELKNAGVSDEVVKELLRATKATGRTDSLPEPPKDPSSLTRELYKQGKYVDLADTVKATLDKNPNDYKARAILIIALLKMKEKDLALREFENLKGQSADPISKKYADQVQSLLDSLAKQEEMKARLATALRDYKSAEATTLVDGLSASTTQKEILKLYLEMYEGKFQQAHERASRMSWKTFAGREQMKKLQDRISESEAAYKKLMERIEVYLHSPLAPSFCTSPEYMHTYVPEMATLSLPEYSNLVSNLLKLAPLDDHVMDLVFHVAMMSPKYEEFELLADRILRAKGRLRLQSYSNDRFFLLTIDNSKRRIFTESDDHPFHVRYAWFGGFLSGSTKESPTNPFNSQLIPFDLSFDEIRGLSQSAGTSVKWKVQLRNDAYALKFEPSGLAPHYALMHFIYCSAGLSAGETTTQNLGRYILHIINNPQVKTQLQDVRKMKAGPGFLDVFGAATLATYGALGAQQSQLQTLQAGLQAAQEQKAQQAQIGQAQEEAWYSLMADSAVTLTEGEVFKDIEILVGVLE